MQKNNRFLSVITSNHRVGDYLPAFSFLLIGIILFAVNAFPALYGDEYGSLFEANNLKVNIHAIGYFFQLYIWSSILQSDWFLRMLSLIWFGAGLYWLNSWLKFEEIPNQPRTLIVWLALLNPFLWMYGLQIRFYAMFFASSILLISCFRAWQKHSSGRNTFYLLLSVLFLLTSHLFGALVLATVFLNYLWTRFGSKRWILAIFLLLIALLIFLPFTRSALIGVVFRMSNPYAHVPSEAAVRGVSLGMLAKVPLTFYFFIFGERVYPLWWWVTIPIIVIISIAFVLGLWQLRRSSGLASLIILMLLNVPLMFLVLDPLAPPGLQGAAPRYVIFVIPYFLLLLALGAQMWTPLKPALIMASLVGLYFLAAPSWSYGGSDFTDWPRYLREAVENPQQTCVITDGRAQGPVARYIPTGTRIAGTGEGTDCLGFSRIILVSDDFRLFQVRYFDGMADSISRDYALVSNATLFPAQITVYEKASAEPPQFVPSRMDLPEQDLRFPIVIPERGWQIDGFVRLDDKTPVKAIPFAPEDTENLWILTNYRVEDRPEPGTPVFSLHFSAGPESQDSEVTLRAGEETATWEGYCNSCVSMYEWTKSLHLLGSFAYPGAYRQYPAHIWGFPLNLASQKFESVTITYLLPNGTGYFWGIYPEQP